MLNRSVQFCLDMNVQILSKPCDTYKKADEILRIDANKGDRKAFRTE